MLIWDKDDIYRIMAVVKVEIDIINSIAASPIGRAGILLIMHAKTFTTDIIFKNLMSYVLDITLTDNFQDQRDKRKN